MSSSPYHLSKSNTSVVYFKALLAIFAYLYVFLQTEWYRLYSTDTLVGRELEVSAVSKPENPNTKESLIPLSCFSGSEDSDLLWKLTGVRSITKTFGKYYSIVKFGWLIVYEKGT